MFRAIDLEQAGDKSTTAALREPAEDALPALESRGVLVEVAHSTLNYKDALALTGKAPVVRKWPMVPGIDFAGTVAASDDKPIAHSRDGSTVFLPPWAEGGRHGNA